LLSQKFEQAKEGKATEQAAKLTGTNRQLARRNLTDEQRLLVLGRMYERQKKAATGFADRDMSGAQNKHRQKTAEKIASLAGVGQATVRRAAEFAT